MKDRCLKLFQQTDHRKRIAGESLTQQFADVAKRTLADDVFDAARSLAHFVPLWGMLILAVVAAGASALLVEWLLSAFRKSGIAIGPWPSVAAGCFAFFIVAMAAVAGRRDRQRRLALVEQTNSIQDLTTPQLMKSRISITIDRELLREARLLAWAKGTTVSGLVESLLRRQTEAASDSVVDQLLGSATPRDPLPGQDERFDHLSRNYLGR